MDYSKIKILFKKKNIDIVLGALYDNDIFSPKEHTKKMYELYSLEHYTYSSTIITAIFIQTIVDKKYFYNDYTGSPMLKWSDLERVRKIYLKHDITNTDKAIDFLKKSSIKRIQYEQSYHKYISYLVNLEKEDIRQ